MQYSPFEKEIIKRLLSDISWEHNRNGKMESDAFAWLIWQKIEYALNQLRENRDRQYLKLLNGLVPDKRGQEECDCHKGKNMCGCRVSDYNQVVEEIDFAVKLAKEAIYND